MAANGNFSFNQRFCLATKSFASSFRFRKVALQKQKKNFHCDLLCFHSLTYCPRGVGKVVARHGYA